MSLLLENFNVLSSCRPAGFSAPGAIPLQDMIALHREYKWDEADLPLREYISTMLRLDSQWRQWHKQKAEEQPPNNSRN